MDLEQGNVARDRRFTANTPHEKRLVYAKRRPAGNAERGKGEVVIKKGLLWPPQSFAHPTIGPWARKAILLTLEPEGGPTEVTLGRGERAAG